MAGDVGGAVVAELALGAEAPCDADGFDAGAEGCVHVDAGVAYVERGGGCRAGDGEDGFDYGGGGLGGALGAMPFDGCPGDIGEEVADEAVGGFVILVGGDGDTYALVGQVAQERGDAWIGVAHVGIVGAVVVEEVLAGAVDGSGVAAVGGERALDKAGDAVADFEAIVVEGMGREAHAGHGIVGGCPEVGDGIEQGAVKVEYYKALHRC